MIKIGSKEIIFNEIILLDDSRQEIWITASYNGENVRICLVFEDTPVPIVAETSVTVEGREDHARVILKNWNRPLGSMTQSMLIGTLQGRNIFLIVDGTRVGTVAKLMVQIMIEGAA